jgi:hypothetical protein
MNCHWSRFVLMAVMAMSAIVGLTSSRTAAQSSPLLPAVTFSDAPGLVLETLAADFNGDGRTDLVGSGSPSEFNGTAQLQVILGNGDGTFGAPISAPVNARAFAVTDFNADGNVDVVARRHQFRAQPAMYVLPGNGDGTLGAPITIVERAMTFAAAADVNRDTRLDLVMGEEPDSLHVYPGNGDLTFGMPVTNTVSWWPHGAVVADFNGDTFPEIIVAARYGTPALEPRLNVLTNLGGLTFVRSDIELANRPTHAAARDLDGDLLMDLVVSARGPDETIPASDGGFVYVYFGAGLGMFRDPVIYPVELSPHVVTLGDFTRDGKLDIATGNRSFQYIDNCATNYKDVDSVSILPGNGDGTFAQRISFALQQQTDTWLDATYRDRVSSLVPSDLNGDGHVDLIASYGKVVLNSAPRQNTPATAFAGDDQTLINDDVIVLFGGGTDPDHHFLRFNWIDENGRSVARVPHMCLGGFPPGTYPFTLMVDDGFGDPTTDSVTFFLTTQ